MVAIISDVYVASAVHGNAYWSVKLSTRPCAVCKRSSSSTCQGADNATRAHNTNAVVVCITNIHVAGAIHGHVLRAVKLRTQPCSVCKASNSSTCQRAYSTIWAHNTNAVVVCITNIHVAGAIHGHVLRAVKLRTQPCSVCKASNSSTCQRAYSTIWAHNTNAVVACITNIHVAGAVYADTIRAVKLRVRPSSVCKASSPSTCQRRHRVQRCASRSKPARNTNTRPAAVHIPQPVAARGGALGRARQLHGRQARILRNRVTQVGQLAHGSLQASHPRLQRRDGGLRQQRAVQRHAAVREQHGADHDGAVRVGSQHHVAAVCAPQQRGAIGADIQRIGAGVLPRERQKKDQQSHAQRLGRHRCRKQHRSAQCGWNDTERYRQQSQQGCRARSASTWRSYRCGRTEAGGVPDQCTHSQW